MAILRSPHAHAIIKKIDSHKALEREGVFAVVTGEEIARQYKPLRPRVPTVPANDYSMAVKKTTYVGEPVALVVAKNKYIAEDALEDIDVEYELLTPFMDPEDSESILVHDDMKSNVAWQDSYKYGDCEASLKQADMIIEERF